MSSAIWSGAVGNAVLDLWMTDPHRRVWSVPAVGAAAWCAVFAAVHLFWAVGGAAGLASSAGRDLAERRPAGFVVFGLFGVAALLLVGIALVMVASGGIASEPLSRLAGVLVAVVGIALVIRGVALEVLLATDAGGLRAAVGPLESRWSLALWNPWFAIGGLLFLWTAIRARRVRRRVSSSQ